MSISFSVFAGFLCAIPIKLIPQYCTASQMFLFRCFPAWLSELMMCVCCSVLAAFIAWHLPKCCVKGWAGIRPLLRSAECDHDGRAHQSERYGGSLFCLRAESVRDSRGMEKEQVCIALRDNVCAILLGRSALVRMCPGPCPVCQNQAFHRRLGSSPSAARSRSNTRRARTDA